MHYCGICPLICQLQYHYQDDQSKTEKRIERIKGRERERAGESVEQKSKRSSSRSLLRRTGKREKGKKEGGKWRAVGEWKKKKKAIETEEKRKTEVSSS